MRQKRTDESYKPMKKRCVALLICVILCLCVLLVACSVQTDSSTAPGSSSLSASSALSLPDSDTSAADRQVFKTISYLDEYPIEVLYEDIRPLLVQGEGEGVHMGLMQLYGDEMYYLDIDVDRHHLRRRNVNTGEDVLAFDIGAEYSYSWTSPFVVMNDREVLIAIYEKEIPGDDDWHSARRSLTVCNMENGERQLLEEYLGLDLAEVQPGWLDEHFMVFDVLYWQGKFYLQYYNGIEVASANSGYQFFETLLKGINFNVSQGNLVYVGDNGDGRSVYLFNEELDEPVELLYSADELFEDVELEGDMLYITVRRAGDENVIHYNYVTRQIEGVYPGVREGKYDPEKGEKESEYYQRTEEGYDLLLTRREPMPLIDRYRLRQLTCYDKDGQVLYQFPPFELGVFDSWGYLRVGNVAYYYMGDTENSLRLASVKAQ